MGSRGVAVRLATGLGAVLMLGGMACSSDDDPMPGLDSSASCRDDADCDDGVFCNGVERCDADGNADDRGCAPGTPPCAASACSEDTDTCGCEFPDVDNDGENSIACGGNDCDDSDPNRFPGNTEVCDREGIDEDCDPSTLGRDGDGDGFVSDQCCNLQPTMELLCGRDCDDQRAGFNPGASDGCGGGDEDCDTLIDEEPDSTFFRDQDSDNFGRDDDTLMACSQPPGYVARGGDCSDDPFMEVDANEINPSATEICDLRDNNCDMQIDEGLMCECMPPGLVEGCGFDPALNNIGICRLGTHTCQPSGMWSTCVGATPPMPEVCNLADDNCNGMVDEGVEITCWQDPDRDGFAAMGAITMVTCTCPDGFTDRDPTMGGADCAPMDGDRFPGADEVCNRIDDDCDNGGGAEPDEDRDDDGHTAIGFAGCRGGFPKDDCFDNNRNVFPGQAAYFDRNYCPPPLCGCIQSGCAMRSATGLCPFSCVNGPLRGSFDYNCDGMDERRPSSSSGCFCPAGFGCEGSAPIYSGRVSCGADVTWKNCGSGGCGSCSGAGPNTTEPLTCR
ncbi:MAG: putative metal-binding motif-containing protein [Myxococcota bacterium]